MNTDQTNVPTFFDSANEAFVKDVNLQIRNFISDNQLTTPLGPGFKHLSFETVVKQLQLYRMHNKFEYPDKNGSQERSKASIEKMLEFDSRGIKHFAPSVKREAVGLCGPMFKTDMDPYTRHQLYNARLKLNEIIADYRFSISSLEFPSGETYVSAKGDISLYAKLRDRKQWCVTAESFDLFARVAYNTPMLKFAARRHIKMVSDDERKLWCSDRVLYKSYENDGKHVGFNIFKYKLKRIVTFCDNARLTTVPKNNAVDRVIMCELFCNMICQRVVEIGIRDVIKKHFDIDLDSSHLLHKALISDLDNVTIDLKNASNSIWLKVVEWFIGGTKLYSDLYKTRSHRVASHGHIHELNMLSPMGNGYTFGFMTLLLLVICRQYDSLSYVFGDDIIVDKSVASDVITLLEVIGLQTNETKTFINGSFRESCGGFFSQHSYITSFDITYSNDVVDAIVTVNKIGTMSITHQTDLTEKLFELHKSLIRSTPAHLLQEGDLVSDFATVKIKHDLEQLAMQKLDIDLTDSWIVNSDKFSLTRGVICPTRVVLRRQRQCHWCKSILEKHLLKNGCASVDTGLVAKWKHYHLVKFTPMKKSISYKRRNGKKLEPTRNVSRLFSWFYIWQGKIGAPTVRETEITFTREITTS